MTQPKFAPILIEDEVRPTDKLEVPRPWRPHRPSEHAPGPRAATRASGAPGPDQGYALALAERIAPRVVLGEGERIEDVLCAAVSIGLRRAATFGRAPVLGDLEFALAALGYLAEVAPELAERRRRVVSGLSHDYFRQRALADSVPEGSLRSKPGANGSFLLAELPGTID